MGIPKLNWFKASSEPHFEEKTLADRWKVFPHPLSDNGVESICSKIHLPKYSQDDILARFFLPPFPSSMEQGVAEYQEPCNSGNPTELRKCEIPVPFNQ